MKTIALLVALSLLPVIADANAIHTKQVTIGAATTQISTSGTYVREVIFQNNATHTMRVGDITTSSTKGALLASGSPGGSMTIGPLSTGTIDLSTYYVNGTQNDVIDVVWID